MKTETPERKKRLIDAAVNLMRRNGYTATSVDQICAEAGVTKGSFFHYFASKEEICLSAMETWACGWVSLLSSAGFEEIVDPLDRLDRLFDLMADTYALPENTAGCLIGTVAQESAMTNEVLRERCGGYFEGWTRGIARMLADAKRAHPPKIDFDPEEVAWMMNSFVQGTLLVAKTRPNQDLVLNNVRHLRAYVHGLFW